MAGWVRILFQVAGNNPNQEEEPIFLQQVGNANNPNRLVLYISHLDGRVTILFQVAGNIHTTNRQVLFLSHMAVRLMMYYQLAGDNSCQGRPESSVIKSKIASSRHSLPLYVHGSQDHYQHPANERNTTPEEARDQLLASTNKSLHHVQQLQSQADQVILSSDPIHACT